MSDKYDVAVSWQSSDKWGIYCGLGFLPAQPAFKKDLDVFLSCL